MPTRLRVAKPHAAPSGTHTGAGEPGGDTTFLVGFYNIGWQDSHLAGRAAHGRVRALGKECARAIQEHCLSVLCLCEFGTNRMDENPMANIGDTEQFKTYAPGKTVHVWLKGVIEQESGTTSLAVDVTVLGPYAVIVVLERASSDSPCQLHGPIVNISGTVHSYRKAVRAHVRLKDTEHVAEVWVHHANASRQRKYGPEARK